MMAVDNEDILGFGMSGKAGMEFPETLVRRRIKRQQFTSNRILVLKNRLRQELESLDEPQSSAP